MSECHRLDTTLYTVGVSFLPPHFFLWEQVLLQQAHPATIIVQVFNR